ncbi:BQ5605_C010g05897 [Microbotryum silenes-dioicae]|uniref:BQ5605_C010g05897 protein n=1 Tax=Microbotryum silenes-dioicae TaxID=796604 RepID=A0A2X0LUD2_9BASI|nr:BQ5605_C010g05897 [Microbotryum silenes-dioicae]
MQGATKLSSELVYKDASYPTVECSDHIVVGRLQRIRIVDRGHQAWRWGPFGTVALEFVEEEAKQEQASFIQTKKGAM